MCPKSGVARHDQTASRVDIASYRKRKREREREREREKIKIQMYRFRRDENGQTDRQTNNQCR
jgi:hypothetical protein